MAMSRGAARAHRFLLPRCPIQLPKLLIGLRAASFGTRQVKNREMSAAVQTPRGNAISYTRASAGYEHRSENQRRVQPLETGNAEGVPKGCLTSSV